MMLCLKSVSPAIPQGFEALESALPLTVTVPALWIVPVYDQRYARYGLLLFDADGVVITFLSQPEEIDALCALVEFSCHIFSYWRGTESIIKDWRSIWWMAQTAMSHYQLRMALNTSSLPEDATRIYKGQTV